MTIEELSDINEDLVYIGTEPSQFKDAIIGISYDNCHVIYDVNKLAQCFMEQDGMSNEEAIEHIDYNVQRSIPYMGECHPILIYNQ